jgi:transposase
LRHRDDQTAGLHAIVDRAADATCIRSPQTVIGMLNVVCFGDLIKIIWHDGQGACLFSKRLERGRFIWPAASGTTPADASVAITPAQLGYLLEGIDWRAPRATWRPEITG